MATKKKTITKSVESEETISQENDLSMENTESQEGAVDTAPEADSNDGQRLVANRLILYRSRLYNPEEELPADDADMVAAWLQNESARWASIEPDTTAKATPKAAQAGLFGKVESGEKDIDGNDLVGRVPKTTARSKK